MLSNCCLAPVIKKPQTELFHGCDDEYEFVVPFWMCTKCGTMQLTAVETEKDKSLSSVGGNK